VAVTSTSVDPTAYAATFDDRVGEVVREAARRSPAFATRLDEAGIDPASVATSDLDRLPIQSKDDVLALQHATPPFGGLLADDAHPRRIFQSPGPLYEPELSAGDGWRWAPALTAAGFTAADRVLITFGFHLSPAGAMFEAACAEIGATVLPAGVGAKDLQVAACRDLQISAYIGTPSYLNALLEAADQEGVELGIQRAFVTAEPLPPSLREALQQRGPIVRAGYGTAETGHLGHECDQVDGWHVPEDALVQICDITTEVARTDGGEGQLVVTLFETGYPIVRFGTGDLSAWHDQPCPCGAATPRLRGWMGRVGDAVKVRGMFLPPRQISSVLADIEGVAAFRVVVERAAHRDQLRVELVAEAATGDLTDRVAAAIHDGLRFRAEVRLVDALPDDGPVLVDDRTWD